MTKGCDILPYMGKHIESCCGVHDIAYAQGGSSQERKKVDERFRACIEAHGYWQLAAVMYWAVRVFGWVRWRRGNA